MEYIARGTAWIDPPQANPMRASESQKVHWLSFPHPFHPLHPCESSISPPLPPLPSVPSAFASPSSDGLMPLPFREAVAPFGQRFYRCLPPPFWVFGSPCRLLAAGQTAIPIARFSAREFFFPDSCGKMGQALALTFGSYVVEGVLMGYKTLISNEEQVFKKFTYF